MTAKFPWARKLHEDMNPGEQPEEPPGPRITEETRMSRKVVMREAEFMRLMGLPGEVPLMVTVRLRRPDMPGGDR